MNCPSRNSVTRTQLCRLPHELHDWLNDTAAKQHTTKTALIIRAIRELRDRTEQRPRLLKAMP